MKNLQQLKKKQEDLRAEVALRKLPPSHPDYKAMQKEHARIQAYILYLESEPTEEFLLKERVRLEAKLEAIDAGFEDWRKSCQMVPENITVPKYNQFMNRGLYSKQLETINYILS